MSPRFLPSVLLTATLVWFAAASRADDKVTKPDAKPPEPPAVYWMPAVPDGRPTNSGPVDAKGYIARGAARYQRGEYDKAIEDYDEALYLEPGCTRALNGRGLAWCAKGAYDKAVKDFDETIRLGPRYAARFYVLVMPPILPWVQVVADRSQVVLALTGRGIAYHARRDYDRAIKDYDEAIRLDPQCAAALTNRGNTWVNKGNYDAAIRDCDEALRIEPKCIQAFVNRGLAHAGKGDQDKAIMDLDQAARLGSEDARVFLYRGRAWCAKGDCGKAISDYERAIRLDPKCRAAYRCQAWLLSTCPQAKYRDGPRAVDAATRACELSGWSAAADWETLAAAYAECGRFDEAAKWQEKALQDAAHAKVTGEEGRQRLQMYRDKRAYPTK